ncbi:MAG: hypothetical protein LBO69_07665 [Ignavibacteria bacterium]|jgi:hypothetical protein|nr:hypothetical protein [Ignavibacteria bacterium]
MKKQTIILILFLFTISISVFGAEFGVNVGFNTFRLFGDLASETEQFRGEPYNGGGLRYIEPGLDISAMLFIDSGMRHRIIFGGEYIGMNAREVMSYYQIAEWYKYHSVQIADVYLGYHFAFLSADWQDVKLFVGPEIMLNNILSNEITYGLRAMVPSEIVSEYESNLKKDATTRIGGRIRFGFEGCLSDNIYLTSSFNIGAYNLFMRVNSNGELFNSPGIMDTKEHIQPFFNFLIAFQYRF